MRLISLFMALLAVAVCASAEPWRPFLGAGLNLNTTDDHFYSRGDKSRLSAARKLPDHSGTSLQFEGGIIKSAYSVYAGYRSGSSSLSDGDRVTIVPAIVTLKYHSSEITSRHFALGGRLQPYLNFMPEWLRPLIGVGVTYGHATKKTNWTTTEVVAFFPQRVEDVRTFNEELESTDRYGGILEFGFSVRPAQLPLQVFLGYEIHPYDARFSNQVVINDVTYSPTAPQYEIRENGFKLGLIYHFGSLGGE